MNECSDESGNDFELSLPMPRQMFLQLFDYLNEQSETNECAHNFNMTNTFLKDKGVPVESVLQWLSNHGAGCDCEVIFNVEEYFVDIDDLFQ